MDPTPRQLPPGASSAIPEAGAPTVAAENDDRIETSGPANVVIIQAVGGQTAQPASGKSNQQLAIDVASALRMAKLSGFEIDIVVERGVVTLRGTVASAQQSTAAEEAAASVAGVSRIDNRLRVDPWSASRGPGFLDWDEKTTWIEDDKSDEDDPPELIGNP